MNERYPYIHPEERTTQVAEPTQQVAVESNPQRVPRGPEETEEENPHSFHKSDPERKTQSSFEKSNFESTIGSTYSSPSMTSSVRAALRVIRETPYTPSVTPPSMTKRKLSADSILFLGGLVVPVIPSPLPLRRQCSPKKSKTLNNLQARQLSRILRRSKSLDSLRPRRPP